MIILFWKIQILDHNKYILLAERNRIREENLTASRGLIKDRNGIILAENRASFNVSIIRENCININKSLKRISKLLGIEENVLKERINQYKFYPDFKPIIIKENLTMEDIAKIEALKNEFPELVIQFEPKRYYPFHEIGAHIIGYVQEISSKELRDPRFKSFKMGDIIGKSGIEKKYDSYLRGKDGKLRKIVDSRGRFIKELNRVEPKAGKDVILTIDFDLQKKSEELMGGREGAIIILNPKNGEILAMASSPSYDPNKFVGRFNKKEWEKLVKDEKAPLENRAIRGLYAPGSIFKLTIALAGLEEGIINPYSTFYCGGKTYFYNKEFSCWNKGGHGKVNLYNAIRHSCNIYFYNLGNKLGIEKIDVWASALGFGKPTGVDLPGEKRGLIPSPRWKEMIFHTPWFPGETISLSIGQGPLLVTPLQIAVHTAIIANRGRKIVPHLVKSLKKNSNERVKVKKKFFELVIKGMWEAVNLEGTGRLAKLEGFNICGKTGSTQLVSRRGKENSEIKTHSWFTGFAPRNDPEVVITVIVEYGGMGGETAAPIAKELFRLYKEKYREKNGFKKNY
ncbi:penicillin-binding protein 2 [SCandidatus Aminicenantes bacterium Aminicenantia_JdfR_composite]|jgi:penicillin-binding protein 2|nr:penicillin-binding protein 2 [SCandidatus Aminicenantes bacterium Aminicenantia_JdfR_composite]